MSHERILIVEDEKITALEMFEHLQSHGYGKDMGGQQRKGASVWWRPSAEER